MIAVKDVGIEVGLERVTQGSDDLGHDDEAEGVRDWGNHVREDFRKPSAGAVSQRESP